MHGIRTNNAIVIDFKTYTRDCGIIMKQQILIYLTVLALSTTVMGEVYQPVLVNPFDNLSRDLNNLSKRRNERAQAEQQKLLAEQQLAIERQKVEQNRLLAQQRLELEQQRIELARIDAQRRYQLEQERNREIQKRNEQLRLDRERERSLETQRYNDRLKRDRENKAADIKQNQVDNFQKSNDPDFGRSTDFMNLFVTLWNKTTDVTEQSELKETYHKTIRQNLLPEHQASVELLMIESFQKLYLK